MKLCLLITFSFLALSAFAQEDKVNQILNSKWPGCDKALAVYERLDRVQIEDLSSNHGPTYIEVYGTLPNGRAVTLELTMNYSCQQGSRGGGGCGTWYQCRTYIR